MREMVGWALAGTVAGLALMSLGATATLQRDSGPEVPARPAAAERTHASDFLADAYFRVAREAPGLEPEFDGWLIRHEITVKGMAAQRGENPVPEQPAARRLDPASESDFSSAGRFVADWRARTAAPCPVRIASLTATLQVRYDWWLLLAEAGAPARSLATARGLYEATRAELSAAERKLAAL